jgi:hypothetical protein
MRRIVTWFGIVAGVCAVIAFALFLWKREARRDEQTKAQLENLNTAIAALEDRTAAADTVYLGTVERLTVRERDVLRPGRELIPRAEVRALVRDCRSLERACDLRVALRDSTADSLRRKVALLETRGVRRTPRLTLYGEGLWDLGAQLPVARAGADLRLFGPFSVTAALDASPRDRNIETRALAGVRYTFK